MIDVTEFGVTAESTPQQNTDGMIAAIGAMLQECAPRGLVFPAGATLVFERQWTPGKRWCIYISPGNDYKIIGNGATLKLSPYSDYTNADTHILYVDGARGATIENLALDGSYPGDNPDGSPATGWNNEQMHGLYLSAVGGDAQGITVKNVVAHHMRGDGYFLIGSDDGNTTLDGDAGKLPGA